MTEHFITPAQLRAARAFLGWSRKQCGRFSNVSPNVIRDMEVENREISRLALRQLVETFASRGIVFVGLDGVIQLKSKLEDTEAFAELRSGTIPKDVQDGVKAIYASAPPLV